MMDGMTNMTAYVNIIATNPQLDSPISLITPISNVFVSVVIIRSEYISKTEMTMNKMIKMLKTRPINRIATFEISISATSYV